MRKDMIMDRERLGNVLACNVAEFAKVLLGNYCTASTASINGQNLIKEVNKLSETEKTVLINHYGLNGQSPKNINNFDEAVKIGIYYSPREITAIESIAFYKLRQGVIMQRYYTC